MKKPIIALAFVILACICSIVVLDLSAQTNTFPASGNVGIGTTSPAALLHILGTSGANLLSLSNGVYGANFVQDGYSTNLEASAKFSLKWGGAYRSTMMFENSTSTANFYLSGTYGAFMNGWGGFKVGHTERFGFFTFGGTNSYFAIGCIRTDNNNWGLTFNTKYQGADIEAGRFSIPGNFMLGSVTDNGNKLQVNGTTWTTGLILPTSAGAGKVLTSDASGNATWQPAASTGWSYDGNTVGVIKKIGTTDNYALPFVTNNVERMRIGTNGSVGIGTINISDAGYKLFLETGIRTRKVKVDQTTWPDYVFHSSYRLPSLKEVEAYIKQHQHLPEVPSAVEVEKNGLDLGENQTILLKKIEELTLYVIQQQKQIEELKRQVENKY